MYSIENYSSAVQTVKATTTPGGVSETELEQTIGIALLADYNQQLADIAQTMQENLDAKESIQDEITELELCNARESTEINGNDSIEISAEEYTSFQTNYPELSLTEQDGLYYVSESSLESVISAKQQDLASLNTTSEMISLQIQSLVDQRKSAITLLSNLIASQHETIMSIINNIRG